MIVKDTGADARITNILDNGQYVIAYDDDQTDHVNKEDISIKKDNVSMTTKVRTCVQTLTDLTFYKKIQGLWKSDSTKEGGGCTLYTSHASKDKSIGGIEVIDRFMNAFTGVYYQLLSGRTPTSTIGSGEVTGHSTTKRKSDHHRRHSQQQYIPRHHSTGTELRNALETVHGEESELREYRYHLDKKTLEMFKDGKKKAEEFKEYLEQKIKEDAPLRKDSPYINRWDKRYYRHVAKKYEAQLTRVKEEIEYFKRNIHIFEQRIEMSTTAESLEQNVVDTLGERNFVTIKDASVETSRGKQITKENASVLDKFYSFRIVYTIETKYQKGQDAIVRTSKDIRELHKVVKLYVPSIVRQIIRSIQDSYKYYDSHLTHFLKKHPKTFAAAGVVATSKSLKFLNHHHAAVIAKASPLLSVFGGPAWLAIALGSWTVLQGVKKMHTYSTNDKFLENRERNLARKIMESNLFLNMLIFFVARADAKAEVDALLGDKSNLTARQSQRVIKKDMDNGKTQRRRSSFTRKSFREDRRKSARRQSTFKKYRPDDIFSKGWRAVEKRSKYIDDKLFGKSDYENYDVQAAKEEIAAFFKQKTKAMFKPIVDVLKLELIKTKKLESTELNNTDAQDQFDKITKEILEKDGTRFGIASANSSTRKGSKTNPFASSQDDSEVEPSWMTTDMPLFPKHNHGDRYKPQASANSSTRKGSKTNPFASSQDDSEVEPSWMTTD